MHSINNCKKDRVRGDMLSATWKLMAITENFINWSINNAQPKPRENPRVCVSIPHVKGVSEQIWNHENIKTAFKPLKMLCHVFKKPTGLADKLTVERNRIVSCRTWPFTYTGEIKRSWKYQGIEHKPWTNGNVGSMVKQHAKTIGHDIHPDYASSLETGVKAKDKRLFL